MRDLCVCNCCQALPSRRLLIYRAEPARVAAEGCFGARLPWARSRFREKFPSDTFLGRAPGRDPTGREHMVPTMRKMPMPVRVAAIEPEGLAEVRRLVAIARVPKRRVGAGDHAESRVAYRLELEQEAVLRFLKGTSEPRSAVRKAEEFLAKQYRELVGGAISSIEELEHALDGGDEEC